ncbi:RNA methyltransferase [Ottowia sp. GY511]|uniref:RNA methyltransferase n=1 Tax=Ottowia flava TaxID=2675430 RepID=A0ABW4KSB8_9BURK|nr:RNA methyltransferase [Ottowia sp. GY511]TXK23579.1 RNA methyltransferase [Ottowia sp. GY511]
MPSAPLLQPRTRFVLIETSHAGNVGAVARAMKVMGFDDLVLVRPRWPDVLTRDEAVERASGATDILQRARSVATLDEALDGMTHLCATAMTPRDFGPPTRAPREHFGMLLKKKLSAQVAVGPEADFSHNDGLDLTQPQGVAFLFGPERYGMANDDVYRCHVALSIPTDPAYGSLNLAAAVQLIAYDWRQALGARGWGFGVQPAASPPALADAAQQAGMLAHWQQALVDIGFLDPAAPKKLMPRLTQLFNRAQPTVEEIHILRGIAKAMQQAAATEAEAPARGQVPR